MIETLLRGVTHTLSAGHVNFYGALGASWGDVKDIIGITDVL